MFRNILVATDLEPNSASALVYARELGRIFGSKLIIAHVVLMPSVLKKWGAKVFETDLKAYRDVLARQQIGARAALESQVSAVGLASARGVQCVVRAGDPASQLAELIDELGVDLTVVGRGRGGKLGPVAERLVRLVGRAVLVTPSRAARGGARVQPARRSLRRAAT
ncbi:MAG: universal stress protein [Deltaproteobacteria bacterium]|nr:universal stress protein [Deltaproteobacteria bacterium]